MPGVSQTSTPIYPSTDRWDLEQYGKMGEAKRKHPNNKARFCPFHYPPCSLEPTTKSTSDSQLLNGNVKVLVSRGRRRAVFACCTFC